MWQQSLSSDTLGITVHFSWGVGGNSPNACWSYLSVSSKTMVCIKIQDSQATENNLFAIRWAVISLGLVFFFSFSPTPKLLGSVKISHGFISNRNKHAFCWALLGSVKKGYSKSVFILWLGIQRELARMLSYIPVSRWFCQSSEGWVGRGSKTQLSLENSPFLRWPSLLPPAAQYTTLPLHQKPTTSRGTVAYQVLGSEYR